MIDHVGTTGGRAAAPAVPLNEAAPALGIGRATARRGCAAGTHGGARERAARPHVGRPPPGAGGTGTGTTPPPPGTPAAAPAPELVAAQEAVTRLEAHVADLRGQLQAREREVGQLHTLLAQAHQCLLTDGQAAPRTWTARGPPMGAPRPAGGGGAPAAAAAAGASEPAGPSSGGASPRSTRRSPAGAPLPPGAG